MAYSREELLAEARRRGLTPPQEVTGMQQLAEVGRGALGEFADVGRAGIGAAIETVAEDVAPAIKRGLGTLAGGMGTTEQVMDPEVSDETFADRYAGYKRAADAEREYVAQADPELSSTMRNVGTGLSLVAGGGLAGKAVAKGLTRATKGALRRGASRVQGGAAKPRVRYRGGEVVGASGGEGLAAAVGRAAGSTKNAAMVGGGLEAMDSDATLGSIATAAAGGAVVGKGLGGILSKFGLSGAQGEALRKLMMDTPIGRMGISQIAKKLGLSNAKAAALWYALHPASRRGLKRAKDAFD